MYEIDQIYELIMKSPEIPYFFGIILGWKFQANPIPKNPRIPGFCKIPSRKSRDWKILIPLEPVHEYLAVNQSQLFAFRNILIFALKLLTQERQTGGSQYCEMLSHVYGGAARPGYQWVNTKHGKYEKQILMQSIQFQCICSEIDFLVLFLIFPWRYFPPYLADNGAASASEGEGERWAEFSLSLLLFFSIFFF